MKIREPKWKLESQNENNKAKIQNRELKLKLENQNEN